LIIPDHALGLPVLRSLSLCQLHLAHRACAHGDAQSERRSCASSLGFPSTISRCSEVVPSAANESMNVMVSATMVSANAIARERATTNTSFMHCSSNCRVSGIARVTPIAARVTAPTPPTDVTVRNFSHNLLENLKLGDGVAQNAYEFTFSITLPLFLLHSGPASGEIVPVGDGALVARAGLVESTAAAPSLSPRGRQRAAWPEQSLTWPGDRGFESAFLQRRVT
jgi:hypothetical protein